MSESLGPGSTFAGCRIEAEAGRGGMGVVFRATQLALQRPVALKAIAPGLAADRGFRERFQRESHLAASIEHPNVIPIYEAGELDGTLYLIMRWVQGTDLRTLLADSGRASPGRAIKLLRPVASALAAAHRRGLVHRDVKPANVLVARSDEGDDDHVYLTDFGIARRTDGESLTRTGAFIGTVDYTAPERFEGGRGDAASDIYSFGCVLFEALTGHVPYDRPTAVSKIYAHVADPIPSARETVPEVPEELDAIIAKAMAKRPEDRFASAAELTAELERSLEALDTAERAVAAPKPSPGAPETQMAAPERTPAAPPERTPAQEPERLAPTAATEPAATQISASAAAAASQPPAAAAASQPPATLIESGRTTPAQPSVPPPSHSRASSSSGRSPFVWLAPILVLSLAGVLIATLSDNPAQPSHASSSATNSPAAAIKLHGGGMTVGRTFALSSAPGSVSLGIRNVWVSLPDRGQLIRTDMNSGAQRVFPARGRPTAIAAGTRALWVAQAAGRSLAQFNGDSGAQVGVTGLPGGPVALALDSSDSSAWVADSSGAISHVAIGGAVLGTPAGSIPAPTSLVRGEGWLWATTGTAKGLVRVSSGTSGSSAAFAGGAQPVAVTLDQGVWVANANGHVTRFDPRPGRERINADVAVAPDLNAIAATDPSPFVWAISKSRKTVYRLSNTSTPAVTGSIQFSTPPVALAVNAGSVWVATQNQVAQIRF